jgi:hypothetical protein
LGCKLPVEPTNLQRSRRTDKKRELTIALFQGHYRQLPNHKASLYGHNKRSRTLCLGQPQSLYGKASSDYLSATGEVWERLFLLAHRVCDDLPWSKDVEGGIRVRVPGISTFFINGRLLVGAQPLQSFVRAIQESGRRCSEEAEPCQHGGALSG